MSNETGEVQNLQSQEQPAVVNQEQTSGSLFNNEQVAQSIDTNSVDITSTPVETPPKWYYDKDVPGTGDMPEGFDEAFFKQYGDIMTAAKGVGGLRKKLGGFTGAPEDGYKYDAPEDFKDIVDVDRESPLYKSFEKVAKEKNMSNEMFGELINLYLGNEVMGQKLVNQDLESRAKDTAQSELGKLGSNAESKLADMKGWVESTLPPMEAKSFLDNVKTAEQFAMLEQLRRGMSQRNLPAQSQIFSGAPSLQQYEAVTTDPRYVAGTPFYKENHENVVIPYLKYSLARRNAMNS